MPSGNSISVPSQAAGRLLNHDRFPTAPDAAASKTLRAAGTWRGRQQSQHHIRDFDFLIDEPEKVGGRNQAPTPMEYMVAALNGCLSVMIDQNAHRLGLTLAGLDTYSVARQDQRGMAGDPTVQPYFHRLHVNIVASVNGTDEQRARLARTVESTCPALNLMRDANIQLSTQWVFVPEVVPHDAEARANRALGYQPRHEPEDAPMPFLVIDDALVSRTDTPPAGSSTREENYTMGGQKA